MLSDHFYHGSIRKIVAVFGTLFNDLKVVRTDSDGSVRQITRVPLAYGPIQKFLARIQDRPNLTDPKVAIKLPRMSFEITSLTYDATSKHNRMQTIAVPSEDPTQKRTLYAAAPYKISLQLNIMAKNQDDALQLIEQIIPYFQPEYTVTINEIPEIGIKSDMPIVMTGITMQEDYEGDFASRRAIIYTLDFETRVKFYGPIDQRSVIKKVIVDINDTENNKFFEEYIAEINPYNSGPDDQYEIIETIDFIDDNEAN